MIGPMSIFGKVNSLVATELQKFAKQLRQIVSEDGEIEFKELIDFLKNSLNDFTSLKVANTEYLVFKLSDQPEHVQVVVPDQEPHLQSFRTKVRFIEEVFPRIRNTDLFFQDGQRIVSFFHHTRSAGTCKVLKKHYENLISYKISDRDLRKRYTEALLVQTAIEKSTRAIEAEFCREASGKSKLAQGINVNNWSLMKGKAKKLEQLGKENYGFPLSTSLLVLLQKWLVFPDTAVFFYPMPRPGTEQSGQGGIVWGVKFRNKPNLNALWCVETYAFLLCSFVDKVIQVQHQRIARQASIRSAVAAVMSRNMSHNIGSHVLTTVATEKKLETLNFRRNQTLYRFLQSRMDFIAQISTEFPRWSYAAWFVKQIMRDFFSQEHLLSYIAISENVKREKLKFKIVHNGSVVLDESKNGSISDLKKDSLIAIPGGVVGNHAFYVILEDIIRNSAKHGYASLPAGEESKHLEITIKVEDRPEDEFVTFTIFDNISRITSRCNDDLPDDCERDTDSLPLHLQMNCKLIRGMLDATGRLRKEDWGLAEMKIAAGYLQKKSIREIGEAGKENLSIIKAVAVKLNAESHLGYTFRIPKPKEVLLVGFENHDSSALRKYSIFVTNEIPETRDYEFLILDENVDDSFLHLLKRVDGSETLQSESNPVTEIKTKIELLPYRLFLVSDSITFEQSQFLKNRIVILKRSRFDSLKKLLDGNKENAEDFKLTLYTEWLKHLWTLQFKTNSSPSLTLTVKTQGNDSGYDEDEIEKKLFTGLQKTLSENDKKQILRRIGIVNDSPSSPQKPSGPQQDQDKGGRQEGELLHDIKLAKRLKFIQTELKSPGEVQGASDKIAYVRHKYLDSMKNCLYFENLSGSAQHFPILEGGASFDHYQKMKLICQLVENGLLRIGIADERVCNSSIFQSTLGGHKFKDYMRSAKVYFIDKLNTDKDKVWQNRPGDFDCELTKEGKVSARECTNPGQWEYKPHEVDILIFHQGVLDKLKMSQEEIEKWIDTLKEHIPFVVVTSGRGRPENVPASTKYLPFSVIESFVISKPHHKFLLTSTLMNIVEEEKQST